jgi:hypothetical protein
MMNERDFYFSLDSGSRETVSYSPRFLKYKFHIYEYIFLPRHKYYTYIFFTLFRIGLIRGNEEREMCVCLSGRVNVVVSCSFFFLVFRFFITVHKADCSTFALEKKKTSGSVSRWFTLILSNAVW